MPNRCDICNKLPVDVISNMCTPCYKTVSSSVRRYRKLGLLSEQLKSDIALLRTEIESIRSMLEDIISNKKYKIMLVNLGEMNENSMSDTPPEEKKRSMSR